MSKEIPKYPFVLRTSLSTINENTTAEEAKKLVKQIEVLYDQYFGEAEPIWTWGDIHDLDRDALIELNEVIRAASNPPLDTELVSSFRTDHWKKHYQNVHDMVMNALNNSQ